MNVAQYVAGVCNIGKWNRLSRLLVGIVLLVISIAGFFWLKQANWNPLIRLILFFPLYGGFLGLTQAALGFCVLTANEKRFDLK